MFELLPQLRRVRNAEAAVAVFTDLLRAMGAESGVFVSAVTDDAVRTSIRSLLACDPQWSIEYSRQGWHNRDPWIRHAIESDMPIHSSELLVHPWEEGFVQTSSSFGFRSALVVPAPSCFGAARVGVLVLGCSSPDRFEDASFPLTRILARALAMELHDWVLASARDDLLEKSKITQDQIDLLRHEAAGLSSKMIAAELGITPKAVDRRFERLCMKLDAPDRQTAVRIARLYDLL